MSPPRRRFAVDHLPQQDEPLSPEASHHLIRVLRLGAGATIIVFDGSGQQRAVEVLQVSDGTAWVRPIGPVEQVAPEVQAHLALALLKPKALDTAVRMAVEAGITHLHIFPAERSVRRPARMDRWTRLAQAAAQQCGRADLPELHHHDGLAPALAALGDIPGATLWIALPGADPVPSGTAPASVLVGPEGGFNEREVELALEHGARPVGLGRFTLRADTAAALASAFAAGADAP